MEFYRTITISTIFLALLISNFQISTCNILKGSVTCLDCDQHTGLSDIEIEVKCNQVKNTTIAKTESDGSFETKLPSDNPTLSCQARILGGPEQLYGSNKNIIRPVVKIRGSEPGSYVLSKPLQFYHKCPLKDGKCGSHRLGLGSSKTVDLPLPKEWGLAPSSYYITPYFPIIGIP